MCDTSCLYLQMVRIALGGGVCGDVSGLSPFVCVNASHKGAKTRKLQPVCTGCVVVRLVQVWWGRRAWGGAWGGDFQIRGLRPFCVCVCFLFACAHIGQSHTQRQKAHLAHVPVSQPYPFSSGLYTPVSLALHRGLYKAIADIAAICRDCCY